jgi:hypothetical protein
MECISIDVTEITCIQISVGQERYRAAIYTKMNWQEKEGNEIVLP